MERVRQFLSGQAGGGAQHTPSAFQTAHLQQSTGLRGFEEPAIPARANIYHEPAAASTQPAQQFQQYQQAGGGAGSTPFVQQHLQLVQHNPMALVPAYNNYQQPPVGGLQLAVAPSYMAGPPTAVAQREQLNTWIQ